MDPARFALHVRRLVVRPSPPGGPLRGLAGAAVFRPREGSRPPSTRGADRFLVASAFLGTIGTIRVYSGWQNGYRRAIAANLVVWGLLFLTARELPPAQRLLTGLAFGGLTGAIFPLAFLRLRSRGDRWWPRRRFALQLPAPQ